VCRASPDEQIGEIEIFCTRNLSRKNLDSDDHFDRPFLFMGVKGKLRNQKERDQLNNNSKQKI